MNSGLKFSIQDGIATITLDRPEHGNAIDLPLAQSLLKAAISCDHDSSIRCVVLTGKGTLFCAGGDLGAFVSAGGEISGFLSGLAGTLHLAVSRLMRMNKPLVVLVNGPAAGAGMSLSLIGDIVLAQRSAHFTPAYGAIGLSPDGGLSWQLPRLVGLRRAQEMLLLNKKASAQQAQDMGLITRVVEDGQLEGEGYAIARTLAAMTTPALGRVRSLLLQSYGNSLEAHLEQEARHIAELAAEPHVLEKVTAFVDKRSHPSKQEFRHG
ncbi:enoyl-CoA hydratase/isomerase family protein [Pseudomonas sp. NPDC089918]|uniref:enoyl-CoA hydratase/isomerase family protein n=1 Tax=Pseudomonas sp. NPDC089918 TaxID=3390654 RepID=UPI003CFBC95E